MNPHELIKILETKLEEAPSNLELKERLAFLLLSQGNIKRAEDLLNEILKIDPNASNALWGLAKINWQKSSIDKAHTYMNLLSSLSEDKLNKEQALTFAKILAKKSSFSEASKWLDLAIAQDSSLLQTENTFLKFIRQNLVTKANNKAFDQRNQFEFSQPSPGGENNSQYRQVPRHTHYIVLEISHFEQAGGQGYPPGFSAGSNNPNFELPPSDLQNPEHEKEDLNQVKKIVTLDEVGGLKKVKQALIQEIVLPLKNPQLNSLCNSSSNPKVLLYGPPGCGKTHLCKALATESDICFLALRAGDFLDLSYEESELKLAHLLQFARDNKPAIVFIDEIHWLAADPQKAPLHAESYLFRINLLNLLLDSLSGSYSTNNQIGLIATTNKPWLLDKSFFTTNKISKHIYLHPPSAEERTEILKIALESRKSPVVEMDKVDFVKVIKALPNLQSGADIEEFADLITSDLLVETVLNMQNGTKDKQIILSTDRLIKTGKLMSSISVINPWIEEAKKNLKSRDSSLHILWEQVADNLITSSNNPFQKLFRSLTL
ncbi:MAG: AAA family ATPase [Candidatus Caenarcaniphilales bacterium]|nr:AAA family ATPase [Candidatus Caenarcaniphilales bacterium]